MTFCFIRHDIAPKRFSRSIRILFSMVTSFSPGSESLLYRMAFFIWIIEFSRICFTKLKYEIRIAEYHLTSLSLSVSLPLSFQVVMFVYAMGNNKSIPSLPFVRQYNTNEYQPQNDTIKKYLQLIGFEQNINWFDFRVGKYDPSLFNLYYKYNGIKTWRHEQSG